MCQATHPLLTPEGQLLIGTIYWKQPPPEDYLALMGGQNPFFDLVTTVEITREAGFLPLGIHRSNDDEWDEFESHTAQKRYLAGDMRAWVWQEGYLRWGMDTMGFCFLLLKKE